MVCLYFGCWNRAGHYLYLPSGNTAYEYDFANYYGDRTHGDHVHIDGTLAPRRMLRSTAQGQVGQIVCRGPGKTHDERALIAYASEECLQGQFLRHVLRGYALSTDITAIQWWDRNQGDRRGGCNSTILLSGDRSTDEMLVALKEHFPQVLSNLYAAGIKLVEVHAGDKAW